jgi:hypothetical protein
MNKKREKINTYSQTSRLENPDSQTSRLENPEELQLHHNHEKRLYWTVLLLFA